MSLKRISQLKTRFLKNWYNRIISDFNYSPEKDYESCKILNMKLPKADLSKPLKLIKKRRVILFAPGPSLENTINRIKNQLKKESPTIIAIDGALRCLKKYNITPHILVSDLDGVKPEEIPEYTINFIHAHGDNVEKIKRIPEKILKNTIGTCQTPNTGNVLNIGGFTDGDRGVIICEIFQAKEAYLVGMDFGDIIGEYSKPEYKQSITANSIKRRKMEYAIHIIRETVTRSKTKYRILLHKSEINFIPIAQTLNGDD